MGIEGLLRNLQPILLESDSIDPRKRNVSLASSQNSSGKKKVKTQSVHNIREFVNCSVAIDASSWLHKAGYSISEALVEAAEKEPSGDWQRNYPHIVSTLTNYIVKRCDELLKYAGIAHITLVYDGERRCPLKMETNDCRNSKRQANLAKARLLKSQGRQKEASELYRACVKVPFSLSMTVMHRVTTKNRKLASVVAPFEADAQLAKLCLDRACQAVITEDSDLLVYSAAIGVPFPIIFKLDRNTGTCDVVSMRWLFPPPTVSESSLHQGKENISPKFFDTYLTALNKGTKLSQYLQAFQLKENAIPGYGRRLFVQACVLAGCDYTVNSTLAPDGIGFVTACKLIAAYAHRPHEERFHHALREWKGKGSKADTSATLESYEELLAKSEAVFYYHYVRCNNSPAAVPLQKTSSFVSPPDHECYSVSNIEKYHVQLPNLHRFKGSTSFLGHSEISSKELASPPKRFQSTDANLRGWISKRSDFLCNSPKKTIFKPKTQMEIDSPLRNNRAVLKEITQVPSKACSRFNFKKSPVRTKEEVKVKDSEDDSIDSFFTSMNWRHNGVRASKTEISLSLSLPAPPRKRRHLSSPKRATSRLNQNQNRFIVFAHKPEKSPPISLPTINPTAVASQHKYDNCCSRQNSNDDDPVQVSVPPKPSKQSCFSATTGHIDLYQSQLVGRSSECFPDSMDVEEEIPSSYPGELEIESISYPHPQRLSTSVPFYSIDVEEEVPSSYPRELEKSISYTYPQRLPTSVPFNSVSVEEEEVPSSYPSELKKKSTSYPYPQSVPICVPFNCEETIDSPYQNSVSEDPKKLSTESNVWTDDDSDCCIMEEKFIPIRGLGTISSVNNNGHGTSKRKTSFDCCKLISKECALSFSPSRKRGRTNSTELCRKPQTSVFSKIARKHEVKGGSHARKIKSQNNSLIRSWLQPLKGKKCRTERSIKDFFLPVVPAKSA